jgi:transposase InsO family protein
MQQIDRFKDIATFRFGIIADFVNGARLGYGDREKLLREKSGRGYLIPHSKKTNISRATIVSWVTRYQSGANQLESLFPKIRSDRGTFRSLDSTVRLGLLGIMKDEPNLTVPSAIRKLRQKKVIGADEKLHHATIYRYLKHELATTPNRDASDRRAFEASYPNEIWQSDVMHGPRIKVNGVWKKTYLCAILDDHSRLIVHAGFYLTEGYVTLKQCLQEAVLRRGIPQKLYVDNGACYSTSNLAYTTAALGIGLVHSRPYIPQGRGKIERWFRTVRESFLPFVTKSATLDDMNEALSAWVDEYHDTEHGTTRMKPIQRYRANLECVRPAPAALKDYFRVAEERKVRKDRTIQLNAKVFEVPVVLIDKKVECLYHDDAPEDVEIRWNGLSYGRVRLLDRAINARVGRDWRQGHPAKRETINDETPATQTGKLFGASVAEDAPDETL